MHCSRIRFASLCLLSTFAASTAVLAQAPKGEKTVTTTTTTPAAEPAKMTALTPDSTTDGTVTVGGKKIDYKAVAGLITVGASDMQDAMLGLDGKWLPDSGMTMPDKPEDAPATARMFYTAYFAKGFEPGTRPVVFFYNGGPGSATMYLRMASMGPVRVMLPDVEHPVGGPYKIIPNEYSLLDTADIVFIDAPGTGYSRVMGQNAFKSFYGIDEDAAAFQRFIRRFLTKYDRWTSPKFLFGESYGTTRDAVLSADLQQHGIDLNGVVFLSQILSFDNSADGSDGNPGTENGFYLALPSFAATAWYHQKYLQDGSDITTGRLDSRFEGPHMDPMSAAADYDPFTESIESAILATMNTYAHDTLKFGENMTYKQSAREPGFDWNMKHNTPGGGWAGTSSNVSADIAYTMKVNPKMHILLMGGYFDLGTLYFGATYEMKHLPIPASLQKNIEYKFFPTGHMVYVNAEALHGLHDRTAEFIRENEKGQ
jgi:carboxypeptidase C (cathepsin A)